MEAQKVLREDNIDVRVVSLASWDRFERQEENYKEKVLPKSVTKRIAIEMGSPHGWERYIGQEGKVIGISTFGASANGEKLIEEYGFTVENVLKHVKDIVT